MTSDQDAAIKQFREHMVAVEVDINAAEAAGADKGHIRDCRYCVQQCFFHFVWSLGLSQEDIERLGLKEKYKDGK